MRVPEDSQQPESDFMPLPPDETTEAPPALPRPRARRRTILREIVETVVLVVVIYTLVNLLTARFVVDGSSMAPYFETGQFVLVNRVSYLSEGPQRGDVVVFVSPDDPDRDYIKRVIGLPGETVRVANNVVTINDIPLEEPYIEQPPRYQGEWAIGENEYFVLGDNRNNSRDSHSFGPLGRDRIIGQALLIYWPPQDWDLIPHYEYGDGLAPSSTAATVPGT